MNDNLNALAEKYIEGQDPNVMAELIGGMALANLISWEWKSDDLDAEERTTPTGRFVLQPQHNNDIEVEAELGFPTHITEPTWAVVRYKGEEIYKHRRRKITDNPQVIDENMAVLVANGIAQALYQRCESMSSSVQLNPVAIHDHIKFDVAGIEGCAMGDDTGEGYCAQVWGHYPHEKALVPVSMAQDNDWSTVGRLLGRRISAKNDDGNYVVKEMLD